MCVNIFLWTRPGITYLIDKLAIQIETIEVSGFCSVKDKDVFLTVMDIHIFRYKQAVVRCFQLNGTDGLCYFTQFYRLGTIE